MRIIVTGSREPSQDLVEKLDAFLKRRDPAKDVLIIGRNRKGIDRLAEDYWLKHAGACVLYPARWGALGRRAGPLRNIRMLAERPDAIASFPMPESVGTVHMVRIADEEEIPVHLFGMGL